MKTDNRPRFGWCGNLGSDPQNIYEKKYDGMRPVVVIPLPFHSAKFRKQLRAIAQWLNVDKWRKVPVLLAVLALSGCNDSKPIPPMPEFFTNISPADKAMDVKQPVMLSWSYVGAGVIPAPTFEVLVWGNDLGTVYGTQLGLPQGPDGMLVRWQLVAYTQMGAVTGAVYEYTTAYAPAPTNAPPPPQFKAVGSGK